MPQTISAKLEAGTNRFAIVVARFNDFVSKRLVDGALDALTRHGADPERVTLVWVPGSFELPLAAHELAAAGRYNAVICLGCLIRGQTPHFEYIAGEVVKGIAHVSLQTRVPVTFGVITADSLEQAIERAGSKQGNKGADAAVAAIEMANVLSEISALTD